MRIQVFSDLHLEFGPVSLPLVSADVVIAAGDIHIGKNGLLWLLKTFQKVPVIYVLGNHEFYGKTLPKLTNELKAMAAGTNVHVLENEAVELDGKIFLGATLWTDLELGGGDWIVSGTAVQEGMTDYRRIRTLPNYSKMRPKESRRMHLASRAFLESQLAAHREKSVVVVTHHAPSAKSLPDEKRGDVLSPAYASNLDELVAGSRAKLWVHGHIHKQSDYRIGSTRVLANPHGYPDKVNVAFEEALVVEIE
jgi:predicted phosphohydrolase